MVSGNISPLTILAMFPLASMRPEIDSEVDGALEREISIRFSGGENIAIPATKKKYMTQQQDYEIKRLKLKSSQYENQKNLYKFSR